MERTYPVLTVTDKAARALRGGHPWVYGEEVLETRGDCVDGVVVDVQTRSGHWLGAGFFNSASKIRVRILSRNKNDQFDEAFWERRLRYAVDYRRTVMGADFSNCRLIFGEADGFPGLTVDRFESVLVAQVLSLGIERIKTGLFSALVRILREYGQQIDAVYERNDVKLRAKEGLEQGKGFLALDGLRTDLPGHVEITENGIRYDVDYINGQKTGFFLDQKYNRRAAAQLARGKRVLDCFTHTGAFGLNCAAGGAEYVVSVDVSEDALETARHNAQLNGLDQKIEYRCADVFELLTELSTEKRGAYDFVILDPPAFTKSSATVQNAIRGYKEINLKAMRVLPRGGYLATCSCSHFMTDELFRKMLADAAKDAQVSLRQIEARQQGPDHPILWNVPETDYLKFYLFQIV
ncbi:MAG: class I SAM-dependent rRNA methyltransferase [Oscillospiraceae bacterium]|nr:class I SAM-dependent rRNA methyltransferase [Oscillospiraceae bacterium]